MVLHPSSVVLEVFSKADQITQCFFLGGGYTDGGELLRRYLRQNAAVKNGVDFAVPRVRKVSDRERQVLTHLIRGRTNKTIAQRLGVSESTVKT